MNQTSQQFTRMSGTDQIIWNLVNDQDLFCIWGIATLTEPLQDALIEKTLKHLLHSIPILNARPVTNWFSGKWHFLKKKDVQDLISRMQTTTDAATEAQLQKIFTTPIPVKNAAMIRLHSLDGPKKHYFVIQVHHLVVDGEGLKRICTQFAAIYRAVYHDPHWQPTGHDPCRSLSQILRQVSYARILSILKALPASLSTVRTKKRATKLARKNAEQQQKEQGYRLVNNAQPADPPPLLPYFTSVLLEQKIMLAARVFTRQQETTVHAVLMASFSLATVEWNTQRGDQRKWLRFFYTANLRRWFGEPDGTFANFSTILTYEEIFQHLQTPSLALARTTKQLNQTKKTIGLDSFLLVTLLPALPYVVLCQASLFLKKKLLAFTRHNQAMTNIGIIPTQAGDFAHSKATGYSLLAPTVAGGCLLFTISTYKDVMTVHLGCTEDGLIKEDGQAFLRLWKQKFIQVITEK